MKWTAALLAAIVVCTFAAADQEPEDDPVFQRVFGKSRWLPADMVEQVKALPPGERLLRDTTGDGQPDEAWYLDTAFRHTVSPLLVRYVDHNGGLAETGRPGLHSGMYFWDHGANGYIDVVTVYQDDDGNGELDQMGIFYDKRWRDDRGGLTVWWAVDIGGDNLLWYDVNGTYYQDLCQWRTHFSGDEVFYQFRLTEDDEKWINVWEDPFAFYDVVGDGPSEMVVRISSVGDDVQNLRYSIDADGDAHARDPRNYDFSITALAPESGLEMDPALTEPMNILGIETHPVLTWENTREFGQNAAWGKAMLSWDEINRNTDANVERDPNPRWEGVLNHASKYGDFPQVGGPPCSEFNNRVEVAENPASPLRLYADPADHRLHLLGADYGYLDVDFNLDGVVDAAYAWKDEAGDGVLDVRTADVNANGEVDFTVAMAGNQGEYALTFEAVHAVYPAMVANVLESSQDFIDMAIAGLGGPPPEVAEVLAFFMHELEHYHPERELGRRIRNSPAGARLYVDLVRDRLYVALRAVHGEDDAWTALEEAYLAGDYATAAERLAELLDIAWPGEDAFVPLDVNGRRYTERVPVTLKNPDDTPRPEWPVELRVADIQAQAPEFNPENCVVVHAERRLAWRDVPHQVDHWAFDGEPRLSFLADLPAGGEAGYYLYYAPGNAPKPAYPRLTNAVLDHPGHIAWESDAGAYRFYTGQIDFFGLREGRLLPRADRLIYPLIDVDYHTEQEWGMDALHVGTTSGLGGITLYVGDSEALVQSPAGEGDVNFEHTVLGSGPVRAAVEVVATNVVPGAAGEAVRLRYFIYGGRAESEVRVALPQMLAVADVAPGLQHLPEQTAFADPGAGCIGVWGYQGDDIGEVGLGIIVDPAQWREVRELEAERRVLCAPEDGELRYWIIGTWRRGMQYPVAPTVSNWKDTLTALAHALNTPPDIAIGAGQSLYPDEEPVQRPERGAPPMTPQVEPFVAPGPAMPGF